VEAGKDLPVLVWRFDPPVLAISSGPLGGGVGVRNWAVNATVPMGYDRDDPDVHLAEVAAGLGLGRGPGVGLLTGLDVTRRVAASDGGVCVTATVGIGLPCWAAAADEAGDPVHGGDLAHGAGPVHGGDPAHGAGPVHGGGPADAGDPVHGAGAGRRVPRQPVGTINIVARVPVRLSAAALVNAVSTVTEAKAQAIWRAGIEATGTCTDAVCVVCPADGAAEPYCGPRSVWGARLARAVYAAVLDGARAWQADPSPWSESSPGAASPH
jgi:adenosylcobinamide amidohydrolase